MVARTQSGGARPREREQQEDGEELDLRQQLRVYGLQAWDLLRRPLVFGAIFALVYAGFGWMYLGAQEEERALESQVEGRRAILALTAPDPEAVESELALASAARDAASVLYIPQLADSDLVEQLLVTASNAGVAILNAGASADTAEVINGDDYTVTPIIMRLAGDTASLERFVGDLESGAIEAFEVKNLLVGKATAGYALTLRAVVYSHGPLDLSGLESIGTGEQDPAAEPETGGATE